MWHPTEHTLELFVLQSANIRRDRERIAGHLEACDDCRARVEEISAIYREAESVFESEDIRRVLDTNAVTRSVRDPVLFEHPGHPVVPERRRSRLRELREIVRQNPIVTGFGGLALVGACAVAAMTLSRTTPADSNPALYQYNAGGNFLEIYNNDDQKLWQRVIWDAARTLDGEVGVGLQYTRIMDLDRDGRNEVVTLALLKTGDDRPRADMLTVFEADKSIRFSKALGLPSRYGTRVYDDRFGAQKIIELETPAGAPELLISLAHHRSPYVLERLNANGDRIGEYWHYGHLRSLQTVRIDGEPLEVLAAAGINDAADTAGGSFGAIVILDPRKIDGPGESGLTPHFGLPMTVAELYYVRFPLTDMELATGYRGSVRQLTQLGDPTLSFDYRQEALTIGFSFEFDHSLAVRTVRINTGTEAVHQQLKTEGKISSTLNAEYTENLKRAVRYWNGDEWVATPTKIRSLSSGPGISGK